MQKWIWQKKTSFVPPQCFILKSHHSFITFAANFIFLRLNERIRILASKTNILLNQNANFQLFFKL
jgi:hypothetical protein